MKVFFEHKGETYEGETIGSFLSVDEVFVSVMCEDGLIRHIESENVKPVV